MLIPLIGGSASNGFPVASCFSYMENIHFEDISEIHIGLSN
jgi:hypothetical protein